MYRTLLRPGWTKRPILGEIVRPNLRPIYFRIEHVQSGSELAAYLVDDPELGTIPSASHEIR
jgi:hypothetical protein